MDFSRAEIERFRGQAPACRDIIHFDNAGAALMPDPVVNTVLEHVRLERDIGGYRAAAAKSELAERFHIAAAELIGARPAEIAFAESATRAWHMAISALAFQPGDRILLHRSEYGSNYLTFLHLAATRGLEIDLLPSNGDGRVDIEQMTAMIRPETRLVSVAHAPMHNGLINPVEEIGAIARAHGLLFALDACQSAGQLVLDVQSIGCHFLAATGRKYLRGPRGTGFLFVAEEIMDRLTPPLVDNHSARWTGANAYELAPGARRFETWERNIAGQLGLTAAIDYALAIGMDRIEHRIRKLGTLLRDGLRSTPGIDLLDQGDALSGIVTFACHDKPTETVGDQLEACKIQTSLIGREQALLDLGQSPYAHIIRASVHYFNDEPEIDRLIEELRRP